MQFSLFENYFDTIIENTSAKQILYGLQPNTLYKNVNYHVPTMYANLLNFKCGYMICKGDEFKYDWYRQVDRLRDMQYLPRLEFRYISDVTDKLSYCVMLFEEPCVFQSKCMYRSHCNGKCTDGDIWLMIASPDEDDCMIGRIDKSRFKDTNEIEQEIKQMCIDTYINANNLVGEAEYDMIVPIRINPYAKIDCI